MLSYRHSYHAGNFADVLKHITLCLVLDYFKQKEKPFVYIDSHAGAGLYNLSSLEANKTGEYLNGIQKIIHHQKLRKLIPSYFSIIDNLNTSDNNNILYYPGSPYFAQKTLRDIDKLILMELHNSEIENLKNNFYRDRRVNIHHRNGFEGLNALCPPTPKRGIVLIDPSYELVDDYNNVINTVKKALQKWNTGCFIIWYPILNTNKDHSVMMHEKLKSLSTNENCFEFKLLLKNDNLEPKMIGSALTVINGPYNLKETLIPILNILNDIFK